MIAAALEAFAALSLVGETSSRSPLAFEDRYARRDVRQVGAACANRFSYREIEANISARFDRSVVTVRIWAMRRDMGARRHSLLGRLRHNTGERFENRYFCFGRTRKRSGVTFEVRCLIDSGNGDRCVSASCSAIPMHLGAAHAVERTKNSTVESYPPHRRRQVNS